MISLFSGLNLDMKSLSKNIFFWISRVVKLDRKDLKISSFTRFLEKREEVNLCVSRSLGADISAFVLYAEVRLEAYTMARKVKIIVKAHMNFILLYVRLNICEIVN